MEPDWIDFLFELSLYGMLGSVGFMLVFVWLYLTDADFRRDVKRDWMGK